MATFEEILRRYGYQFSSILDESGREELLSFWESATEHEGGALSYGEIESILSAYVEVGVIESVDAVKAPVKKERTLEEDRNPLVVAGRLLTQETEKRLEEQEAQKQSEEQTVQKQSEEQAAQEQSETQEQSKTQDQKGAVPVNQSPASAFTRPDGTSGQSDGTSEYSDETSGQPDSGTAQPVITWQVVTSNLHEASVEHPLMILKDPEHLLRHHQVGDFTNPEVRTAFECRIPDGKRGKLFVADILYIDKRFIKLVDYLGSGYIPVRLSGRPSGDGYAVYKIHAADPNGNETLENANDSFLQFNIRRLLAADAPETPAIDERDIYDDDHMLLTDMASMMDFLKVSGDTLPPDILRWAYRNIALVKTDTISPEEKRHAKRALSLVLNVQWKGSYFESIDPVEARRILDEELFGMENVKQRVIETIIQINRTHTLPAYGLLLVGPAGTGKSQIAYAVARILKLPWVALDMSAIHDAEALTGSPRVYSNAKAGRIMEAFSQAGSSNIVFIINELDKAESRASSGNPADALLTLLDNLGYTDNYIECVIPTGGVYPIATANDKSKISDPLLTRFAVIDIPDYTLAERATIFKKFSLPKVLRRMGMTSDEVSVTDGAVEVIVDHYRDMPGVRDLEQAAEHLAANALYRIETTHTKSVVFDSEMTKRILEK